MIYSASPPHPPPHPQAHLFGVWWEGALGSPIKPKYDKHSAPLAATRFLAHPDLLLTPSKVGQLPMKQGLRSTTQSHPSHNLSLMGLTTVCWQSSSSRTSSRQARFPRPSTRQSWFSSPSKTPPTTGALLYWSPCTRCAHPSSTDGSRQTLAGIVVSIASDKPKAEIRGPGKCFLI